MKNEDTALLNLFREVSTKYYNFLENGDSEFSFKALGVDFKINSNELIYGEYEEEFTRTIINEFNKFAACLHRINLLKKIIKSYNKNEYDILSLRAEFIHIPLHYCLNRPYEFAGRIQYCCIILCHQANHLVFNVKDSVEEEKYGFKELKLASKKWRSRNGLLQALESVANCNKDFVQATDHYRNKTQHRLPRNLDIGLSNHISKQLTSSNDLLEPIRALYGIQADQQFVTYSFGSTPPLQTADMIPVLVQQGEEMRKLFYRYWDLVSEQNDAINARGESCSDISER